MPPPHDAAAPGFANGSFIIRNFNCFNPNALLQSKRQFNGGISRDFIKTSQCRESLCKGMEIREALRKLLQSSHTRFVFWMLFQQEADQYAGVQECHRS
jgi:hypothetical protein